MRVAIVTESFLPTLNGVTTSVRKVLEHLRDRGDDAIVIAPQSGDLHEYAGFPVHRVPAIAYRSFPVGLPNPLVQALLARFRPDVVHAASPFLLGAQAIGAAGRLGIPTVAVFQTDVAGYARRNRLGAATGLAWQIVRRVHAGADLTLVPSSASMDDLRAAGLHDLARWGRGVDLETYHPRRRSEPRVQRLHRRLAPGGECVVGYVGRIAPEKQVERLASLRGIPNVRLAIVGDGPSLGVARRALAGMPVSWLGVLSGEELADAYASFDVFVHAGTEETFGQTLQEAHATGLPVVAPRAGGPIDLVDHGHDGFLFTPGGDGMRTAIGALAGDAELRARMGEAGRRAVLGRSWNTVCDELVGHYQAVITARRREALLR